MHYNVTDTATNLVSLPTKLYRDLRGLTRPSQLLQVSLIPKCFKRMKLGREQCRGKVEVVPAAGARGLAA